MTHDYDCTAERLEALFNDMATHLPSKDRTGIYANEVTIGRWAEQVSEAINELRELKAWSV